MTTQERLDYATKLIETALGNKYTHTNKFFIDGADLNEALRQLRLVRSVL